MAESLIARISTKKNLTNAWEKINKNDDSHGYSGETIANFKNNLENKISSISADLIKGKYRFSPNRAAVIPKDNGKFRPLQIPEIQDRVVLKAIALELEEQFTDLFRKSKGISFAYQKKIGIREAVEKMVEIYSSGKHIILEADIINFFGTVDKISLLQNDVYPKLPDDSINALLFNGLNQPILGLEKLSTAQAKLFEGINSGIPQGNPLSPLLSNIYLSGFDQFLSSQGYSLIRYADDFIVLCQDNEEAERCYSLAKEFLLTELQLELHPIEEFDKTRIVDPKSDEFSFLSIGFDGLELFPSKKNYLRLKDKLRNICHSPRNENVLTILLKVKNSFEGWISTYYYTRLERYASDLDTHINKHILSSLRKFDWRFSRKTIGKITYRTRGPRNSGEMLSEKQREHSGIPFCMNLINEKRKTGIVLMTNN